MFSVCSFCSDKPGITWSIATVYTVISEFIGIETLRYRGMCFFITHFCRDTSVKCIEIAKPIPIIELVDILDDSSLDRVELCLSELITEDGCLLTTDSTSTVPDDFLSFGFFPILFEEFWYFTEVDCSCRYCIFEVTETVLIVIAHIEDKIFVFFI